LFFFLTTSLALVWAQHTPEGIPLCPADAALKAVQFVDGSEGWCVGEEGLILHSIDGGLTWEKQPSGTHGTLESLQFLDPYHGWAVGHDDRFPPDCNGIVLYTRDGGLSWKRILVGEVPALYGVLFQGAEGCLAGVANARFPGGTVLTSDGGGKWRPGPGMPVRGWLGLCRDGNRIRLFGPQGKMGEGKGDQWFARETDSNGTWLIRSIWKRTETTLAAGEGGLLLRESEGRWVGVTGLFREETRNLVDFHALGGHGQSWFVAGRTGRVLLHTEDGGSIWKKKQVPGLGTINSIQFVDGKQGWMVGDKGAIWKTSNGGGDWSQVRGGPDRSAVLALAARWSQIPWAPLIQAGWVEGVHNSLWVVGSHPTGEPGRMRSAEFPALRALGVTVTREGVGALALAPEESISKADLLARLETMLGPDPREQIRKRLVLEIRSGRPDALLLAFRGADPNHQGWESLLEELLPLAVQDAADGSRFPELSEDLGLSPWQVLRLFVPSRTPTNQVRIDLMAVRPRLKSSLRDYASEQGLGTLSLISDTGELHYRGMEWRGGSFQDVARKLPLVEARDPQGWKEIQRNLADCPDLDSEELKSLRRKNQVMHLVMGPEGDIATGDSLASNLDTMLKGVEDMQASKVLLALARQSAARGRWNLARELFTRYLDKFPTFPGAADAARWVVLHNSSGEARRRHELRQVLVEGVLDYQTQAGRNDDRRAAFASLQQGQPRARRTGPADPQQTGIAVARALTEGGSSAVVTPIPNLPETTGRVTTQTQFVENALEAKKWYQDAMDSGNRLQAFGTLVAGDPRLRLSLASAGRKLGNFQPTQETCEEIASGNSGGHPGIEAWRKAAAMELWLAHRKGDAPKPVWTCRKVEGRPYLDGDLDEPFWEEVPANALRLVDPREPSRPVERAKQGNRVLFAHDDQFLYVGVSVETADLGDTQAVKSKAPRGHDTGLALVEHLGLLIDIDRDYSTAYLLRVDGRGWIDDECWGDAGWNPRWFVATRKQGGKWETEMAIPLGLLSSERPGHGKTWAVNLFHHDPACGKTVGLNRSPRLPDANLDPQDFGLLYFQNPRAVSPTKNGESNRPAEPRPIKEPRRPSGSRPEASPPASTPEQGEPATPPRASSDR